MVMRYVGFALLVALAQVSFARPDRDRFPDHSAQIAIGNIAITVAVVLEMRRALDVKSSFFVDVILREAWRESCEPDRRQGRTLPRGVAEGDLSVLDQLPGTMDWIGCDLADGDRRHASIHGTWLGPLAEMNHGARAVMPE